MKFLRWAAAGLLSLVAVAAATWMSSQISLMRQVSTYAVDAARRSGKLQHSVGDDLMRGTLIRGHVVGGMDAGTADLWIPIHGERGRGGLSAWLQNGFAGWRVCSLSFHDQEGKTVVIIPDETSSCEHE